MPRPRKSVPSYRLHKQSGQAIVTVNVGGVRRDILLGPHDSPESHAEYRRVLADLAGGRPFVPAPSDLTVNELCLKYWEHARGYYRHPDGSATSELTDLRYAVRVFRENFGGTPAREFGPVAFKRLRDAMVGKGWSRGTVNKHAGRVKRVVRWGVENELLPADRWEALRAVPGLARGRTAAPETERVAPAPAEHVRAVLPFVRRPVRGMIEVQALTGMRPLEVCRLRPCDVDRAGPVWLYRPPHHKTAHRGKARVIPIGPKAQAVLAAFEPADPAGYYFSPRQAVAELRADRAANRKTTRKSQAKPPKPDPRRAAGRCYTRHAYEVAVGRACERAGVPSWSPNQLRHALATAVRQTHGLEAAQVLLGHAKADVTQIYAERDLGLALKVAAEVG